MCRWALTWQNGENSRKCHVNRIHPEKKGNLSDSNSKVQSGNGQCQKSSLPTKNESVGKSVQRHAVSDPAEKLQNPRKGADVIRDEAIGLDEGERERLVERRQGKGDHGKAHPGEEEEVVLLPVENALPVFSELSLENVAEFFDAPPRGLFFEVITWRRIQKDATNGQASKVNDKTVEEEVGGPVDHVRIGEVLVVDAGD